MVGPQPLMGFGMTHEWVHFEMTEYLFYKSPEAGQCGIYIIGGVVALKCIDDDIS